MRALRLAASLAFVTVAPACASLAGLAQGGSGAGSDAGADGGADARRAHDAGADATTADATTADARRDAPVSADGPSDAGADTGGFCASLVRPADAAVLCTDFDEGPDADMFTSTTILAKGTAVVSPGYPYSRPNALLATAVPGGVGPAGAERVVALPSGSTYHLEFEAELLDPTPLDGGNGTVLMLGGLGFGLGSTGSQVYVIAWTTEQGGPVAAVSVFEQEPVDGGSAPAHTAYAGGLVGWHKFDLTVAPAATGGYVDTFVVDGHTVESSYPLAPEFSPNDPQAWVGLDVFYAQSWSASIDNVLVTVR